MKGQTDVFLNVECVADDVPKDAQFLSCFGLPEGSAFEVVEHDDTIMLRQIYGGTHIAKIDLTRLFEAMAVAVERRDNGECHAVVVNQGAGER